MTERKESWRRRTHLIHDATEHNPTTGVSSPIFQSATFRFDEPEAITEAMVAQAHPTFYGRYATPNTKQVEATVAQLEGAASALAVSSGMAAVSLALLSFLQAGDHLVAQKTLYPTTHKLIAHKLPSLGITATMVDQTDVGAFAAAIRSETRLIYVESPANPTLSLTDLAAIADLAAAQGLITVADNTFATPYNQRPLKLGIDLVVHSATKYLGGHSDIVAGVVAGSDEHMAVCWDNHVMLGGVLHPMEAWLLQRGLQTFDLRLTQHNANALAVARFLETHQAVREVYYPGLESHPQHALAGEQMPGGYGGMVCFDLKGGRAAGYALLEELELINLAVSLGGTHSLITHPASTISTVQSEEEISSSGVQPGLVRFSVGLENVEDIIADLDQALSKVPS
ncbi:MAG TPA: aminotransferase class I/II-fold pyridoxal phosphate-dependent enzyme [Candidatus Sulfomarinibacteraceae bacterium]|nr:aminotransferase class I/II-fold pyridoxal phosphate-dependent enzyme [Candidatus Sulfomarinibacteraceae bacterium]